jgi:3-hydroxy-9,10-secoandrosta-1,3,5(10)-triene-9,17-dione monooxygenase reductase component
MTATIPVTPALPEFSPRLPVGECQDQRSFRDVLGQYPTGVVVIATNTPDGPAGMAVNSFASVSLDPPLISFCPGLTSSTWARIRPVGSFAVSVLCADHAEVSRLFARKSADKFAERAWALSPAGHPVVADCNGWIDATVEWTAPAGDHEIVVARAVQWSEPTKGRPLVFFGGSYHSLAE